MCVCICVCMSANSSQVCGPFGLKFSGKLRTIPGHVRIYLTFQNFGFLLPILDFLGFLGVSDFGMAVSGTRRHFGKKFTKQKMTADPKNGGLDQVRI